MKERIRNLSPAWRWALIVAAGCVAMAAINVWWVATYRHGYPLDVDENGYTMIGIIDFFGFENGGVHGWWEAVQNQTPNAPLLPALTSIVLIFSPGVLQGFGVLIAFAALLTLATYGIGERLAGPRLGALAALAVGTSQGVFVFTREYIFALPTAAFLACSVYALIRSEGMRRRWWAVACGAAIGLMLLSRTMAVAFVPGVVVAALLTIAVAYRDELARRALNFGLAVLAAVLVAATWYWNNLDPVVDYLTEFGYGSQAKNFGESSSTVSWDRFKTVAEKIIQGDLLVPMSLLVTIGLIALAVAVVQRLRAAEDRRAEALRLLGSNTMALFVVAGAGFAALMSSQNGGNGFTFPVAVLLPTLAVVALRRYPKAAVPATVAVVAIAAVNLLANSNLSDGISKPRLVEVPAFGYLPWISGEPHAVGNVRQQAEGPRTRFTAEDAGYVATDLALAKALLEPIAPEGTPRLVAFASRNRVVSTNSVGLAGLVNYRRGIPFTQLLAEPDSVAHYERQIVGPELGRPTTVVTTSTEAGDFEPLVTQAKVETALRNLHFRLVRQVPMPDGRRLRVWVWSGEEST
ncbi:MAG TPA: glycosyltransferase family 39 protein [Solirubrobacterales bacterium]|nr:glycosyltransferase family 39 protein [Solirubrobacterales bacterium]